MIEAAETIGGGTRSSELTLPGLLHDECSAVHAMAVGSPALNALGLERHGLEWGWPEVDLAHPLDGGDGAAMLRSIERDRRRARRGRAWVAAGLRRPRRRPSSALSEDIMRPAAARAPAPARRWPASACRAAAPATLLARELGHARRRGRCSAGSPRTPSAR